MSKKTNPLNILYIEDEQQDYERLQMDANPYRILLTHKTNLEDGIKTFKEKGEKYFDGIILDALCLIKKDDSTPKKGHVLKAWKEFLTLAPNLLKVVFTGETAIAQELNEYLEETEVHIFNKGSGEDVSRMLTMFVDKSKNKEDRIIASRYADVFEVFDKGYLDSSDRETLLECIKNMGSNEEAKIKNTLSGIRRLQESIYRAINRIDKDMVPDEFLSGGNVQFRSIQWHFRGKYDNASKKCTSTEYIPKDTNIDQFAEVAYTVASNCGAHDKKFSENNEKFNKASKYTLHAITFAIMDLLLWLKALVQGKTNRK